jgi:aspartyl-tRNA(Asn)/glutamyl-tRNA(Gln) amidotransferase subunit A
VFFVTFVVEEFSWFDLGRIGFSGAPFFYPHMTIEEFARKLRARDVTALEITNTCLRRIDELQPSLNAFIRVMADEARRDAQAADRELASGRDRGPLHGVPVAVKDIIDVEGIPTTAASRVREGHVARSDAPVIARLRAAGAVIVGKTNLDEFAFGTTSDNSAFGAVRHPLDPARSPGGSSGGSAVAVAAGTALAALGTDTGGSIRIPAAACGIVGLKPTLGEISTQGVVPLSKTFDHVGPFARTVGDARIVHQAMSGTGEFVSGGADLRTSGADLPRSARDLRLAIPRGYLTDVLHRDVRARFDEATAALRTAGATLTDVSIPHAAMTPAVYMLIHSSEGATYHAKTLDAVPDRYMPVVRSRLEVGRYVLAQDYQRAMEGRELLRREVDAALDQCDALVLPSLPIAAPLRGADSVLVNGVSEPVRALMLRLTQLFNVTGHPAISIPCGSTTDGLPVGLQLVGRRSQTSDLLSTALVIEHLL